jgi:tetratricopeptide (TPR) repeat protein
MDLLDFDGAAMYFDDPVASAVEELLATAAAHYGDETAEGHLLRAYFLQPDHLTVLVALYRFFYYRQRYREALLIADRAIPLVADRLRIPRDWRDLTEADLGRAAQVSMTLTRFLLMALKGAGYLLLRLGAPLEALERLEKVAEIDSRDRLGVAELCALARLAVAREALAPHSEKVRFITD